ncbi:MAG: cytoplasmic rane protein, partial [bacterium]|nr:cytoplasmic rane protein [bacterium]
LIGDGLLLPPFDFSRIDHEDYRDWLRRHGARQETVTSAPVTALYDLVFAVDSGMAAGATIGCATRMLLTYKGALFYKMQAGMGDTVFTPLYLELKKRGVKFRFFHRVDELKLAFDAASDNFVVDRIVIGRQADTRDGRDYEPLVAVNGVECWPSEPHWEQLARGDELAAGNELPDGGFDLEWHATRWPDALAPLTLQRGDAGDFDDVVLGISIAALPRITAELAQRVPEYARMLEGVKTIATQATQLWFRTDLAGLGWTDPGNGRCAGTAPIAGSYPESLDTWADMSHLIPREGWPDGAVRNIAYFCGQLRETDTPGVPSGASAAVWDKAVSEYSATWAAKYMRGLLPNFDVDQLYSSNPADKGKALWDAQYFRANVKPSERYVLTVPGSTVYRLFADDLLHCKPGCANLFLAGDWVRTGINGGCIEAATMAGMQAARALSGSYFDIVGDPAPFRPRPSSQSMFIERGGDVVYAEPYQQDKARLYAFLLPVDRKRIAALCDRYLNWTGKMLFTPFLDHVALVFAAIDSTYSTDPLYIGRGTMTESDVSFWIPVRSSSPDAPPLSWFLPYVWVDNGIAMAAGREVFGFPKQAGTLTIPPIGAPPRLGVDIAVVESFGAPPNVGPDGPRAVMRNIISVAPSAPAAPVASTLTGSVLHMLRALLPDVLGAGRVAAETLSWFLDSFDASVPMLFLKQFRDVADGRRACYKALVTANSRPTQIHGGGILPGSYDLTIRGFASHPVVRDIGLGRPGEAEATLTGCSGFFVEFDFLMEQGRELWRAP